MPIFPNSLQYVAVGKQNLSSAVEFAIFEVSHINPAIALIPLKPSLSVDEIIFELTDQNSILEMQSTKTLFFAI